MRKIIEIDGKQVPFKASASIALHYKAQFGKDLLDIAMPLLSTVMVGIQSGEIDWEALFDKAAYNLESVDLINLIWTVAYTADKDIAPPIEWFDSFEEFDLIGVGKEIFELISRTLFSSEKSKKKKKTAMSQTENSQPQSSSQPQKNEESPSEN